MSLARLLRVLYSVAWLRPRSGLRLHLRRLKQLSPNYLNPRLLVWFSDAHCEGLTHTKPKWEVLSLERVKNKKTRPNFQPGTSLRGPALPSRLSCIRGDLMCGRLINLARPWRLLPQQTFVCKTQAVYCKHKALFLNTKRRPFPSHFHSETRV